MGSRSVPGAGVGVVGCGVLITDVNDDGGGGVRSGGLPGGSGTMAAVRGRALPKTGTRASDTSAVNTVARHRAAPVTSVAGGGGGGVAPSRVTGNRAGRNGGGSSFGAARSRLRYRKVFGIGKIEEDPDKENAAETIQRNCCRQEVDPSASAPSGGASRSVKRVHETEEGNGPDGDSNKIVNEHRLRPPGVINPRMAKYGGDSRIPLPGATRASFLPKPKVFAQPKVPLFDKQPVLISNSKELPMTPPGGGTSSLTDNAVIRASSTPFVAASSSSVSFSPSPLNEIVSCKDVGKSVHVIDKETIGILRYYGPLEGKVGAWCGIELSKPEGDINGTVRGFQYFSCPPNHGIMSPATKVRRAYRGAKDISFVTGHGLTEEYTEGTMRGPLDLKSVVNSTFKDAGRVDGPNFPNETTLLNDSPVATRSKNVTVVGTGEKNETKTNETRALDEKNRKNSSLNASSAEKSRSKSTSPTGKSKIGINGAPAWSPTGMTKSRSTSGSRTIDPDSMGSPKTNIKPSKSADSTFVTASNSKKESPSRSKTESSSTDGKKRLNDTWLIGTRQTSEVEIDSSKNKEVGSPEFPKEGVKNRPIANVTVTLDEARGIRLIDRVVPEVVPVAKPSGAVFALNDSFINEKPIYEASLPVLKPISYGDRSPVVEAILTKRTAYLCEADRKPSGTETIPIAGEHDAVEGLSSRFEKLKRDIFSGKDGTFLVDKPIIGDQTVLVHQNSTFTADRNKSDVLSPDPSKGLLDGTYFVIDSKDGKEQSTPIHGLNSTFLKTRSSIGAKNGVEGGFFTRPDSRRSTILSGSIAPPIDRIWSSDTPQDSEVGRIDSVTDSCLIDATGRTDSPGADFSSMSIGTYTQGLARGALQDSEVTQIEAIGNSCLIDVTSTTNNTNVTTGLEGSPDSGSTRIDSPRRNATSDRNSGPFSLLRLNGVDEEDELTPPAAPPPSKATPAPHYLMLNKQNSFEHDESLGILTPDQMAEFTMALECSRTPSCENLTGSGGSRIAVTRASASRPSDLPTSVDGEPIEGSSERTPSPEDLPLDPKPAEPPRTVPVSFVTSVTSITSLEAGYQGDGENSRPASRGADPAPVAPPPNLPAPRNDPMTDSDFFTESDADAHEEIVRGDRRAQVIDGTLFCAPGGRRCPSFTGEEMDSSGIYSDLDRRQDEPPREEVQSEGQTPDTADTISQKSQPSPHRQDNQQPVSTDFLQLPANVLDATCDSNNSTGTLDMTVIEVEKGPAHDFPKALSKSDPIPLKKYKMPKRNVVSKIKAMIESGPKDETEKEARRPQRPPRKGGRWDAVMSKIEAGKTEQRSRPPRKEVKSRVLQGLAPPVTPTTARRSPGDSNKSKSRRTRGRQDPISPTQETAQSSVHSSMSDISSTPRSTKKRLGSPGGSEGSAQSTPRISSPRQQQPPSSLTIVNNVGQPGNANNNNTIANGNANNTNANNSNNNQHTTRAASHSQRSPTAGTPPRRIVNGRANQQSRVNNLDVKKNSLDVSRVNLEKSPLAGRKPNVARRSGSNVVPKIQSVAPSKDRGAKDNSHPLPRVVTIETREQSHQTDPTRESLELEQAELSVQALSVIVQYLAHQLDGFSAPRLKKDCERMKTEWLEARLEAEELRAGYRRVEEQLNERQDEHQRDLEQLRADLEQRHEKRITEWETALREEEDKFEARLEEGLNNSNKEHLAAIARLRSEHEAELVRREAETDRRSVVHDQGAALRAEAASLRTVLELRSQEIASLRTENENLRREVETKEALEQKLFALEARCEDLRAQLQRKETFERQLSHENKVLLESFHQESKQNKRLSQHNEELQWRLRQNNEVVTVLANQLTAPGQGLSRSLGPESTNLNGSPDDSPPASPMVKSMVEKSDSVSWTLEIEESPEAVASRLLRRSGSSRGISPSDSRPKRARQPSSSSSSPVNAATVSRQSSLRSTTQRAVVLRARSKSVSVADALPQEAWSPGFSSTPSVVRRRPRSDPATGPVSAVDTSPGLRPQEAGGEAMISEETSASSSEDESSGSSDMPRLAMELCWSESEG